MLHNYQKNTKWQNKKNILKDYKCECISYEVQNAVLFLSFKLSDVFSLGCAVKILVALSRVAHLVHYTEFNFPH